MGLNDAYKMLNIYQGFYHIEIHVFELSSNNIVSHTATHYRVNSYKIIYLQQDQSSHTNYRVKGCLSNVTYLPSSPPRRNLCMSFVATKRLSHMHMKLSFLINFRDQTELIIKKRIYQLRWKHMQDPQVMYYNST